MIVLRMARSTLAYLHILKSIVAGIKIAQGLESTRYWSTNESIDRPRRFQFGYPFDPHNCMYYVCGTNNKSVSVRLDTESGGWWEGGMGGGGVAFHLRRYAASPI